MSKPSNKKRVEPKANEINVKVLKGAAGLYLYLDDVMVAGPVGFGVGDIVCEFNTSCLDRPRI